MQLSLCLSLSLSLSLPFSPEDQRTSSRNVLNATATKRITQIRVECSNWTTANIDFTVAAERQHSDRTEITMRLTSRASSPESRLVNCNAGLWAGRLDA